MAFSAMMGLLSTPKYWRGLMKANLEQAFEHPAVEHGLAAAIGYCFGAQETTYAMTCDRVVPFEY